MTTNLGLYQISTSSPDYEGGTSPIAQISTGLATLDAKHGVALAAANGAIALTQGLVAITKGTAAALTLAIPAVGLPAAAGKDGQILRIVSTTAAAHTVTTPANGLNGNVHIATFAAAIGNFLELVAYNGAWYVLASAGITLS
jgi:hypothetical protein